MKSAQVALLSSNTWLLKLRVVILCGAIPSNVNNVLSSNIWLLKLWLAIYCGATQLNVRHAKTLATNFFVRITKIWSANNLKLVKNFTMLLR